MEKLTLKTPDITAQNIEKIAELFPQCVTETQDENGALVKAVNFEMLKQTLSPVVEGSDETYDFTWVGKKAAMVEAYKPISKTLRPCPEESVDWDNTQNLYIEGDNLEVLKLLQESYLKKVKMIYIDPPYNTGNDFVYRDDFRMTAEEWDEESGAIDDEGNRLVANSRSNGRFHSDWCSMIYARLLLARGLLTDDGVIFISIDDNEQENLKKICDEVFGSDNFVAQFIWEKKKKPSFLSANVGVKTEYLLCYAKKRFSLGAMSVDTTEAGKKYPLNNAGNNLATLTFPPYTVNFNLPDGIIRKQDMSEGNIVTELLNDLEIKDGKNVNEFKLQGEWRYSQEKIDSIISNGDTLIISKIPFRPNHVKQGGEIKKMHNMLTNANYSIGTNEDATLEQRDLFGNSFFDYAKPISLIQLLIKSVTYNDNSALILDFFSGSATTAHAVMQLNAEDGGNRQFIMVQIPEACSENSEAYKAGYKTICDIGKERIRRAGAKIKESMNQDGSLFESSAPALDTGFRVFKTDESNMAPVDFIPSNLKQDQILMALDNIKTDRTPMDLFFSSLLQWGLPISVPYSTEEIDGCVVYTYHEGENPDLMACFDEKAPPSVFKHIGEKKPLRAVFRDSSFADSAAKINAENLIHTLSPDTDVKVI